MTSPKRTARFPFSVAWNTIVILVSVLYYSVDAFHDCVELSRRARAQRRAFWQTYQQQQLETAATTNNNNKKDPASCAGGLCVGMKNGPHEGGNASYPVSWDRQLLQGTTVFSSMTVPELPQKTDGITYYLWTDIFFGDSGAGKMNQLVPQLILGKALDGSSGPPNYLPLWGDRHDTWSFGAHYFFETYNPRLVRWKRMRRMVICMMSSRERSCGQNSVWKEVAMALMTKVRSGFSGWAWKVMRIEFLS